LIFLRQGNLLAAPFDPGRLQLTGQPQRILDGVVSEAATGAAHFDLSRTGTLVYLPGQADPGKSLLRVDPKGSARPLTASRRNYLFPRLSPDGVKLAVTIIEGTNTDIWVYDLARDTQTRFTFEASFDASPVWTPDGRWLAYRSTGAGADNLYWKPADGSGPVQQLTRSPHTHLPNSWSPDGRWLAYTEVHPNQLGDLWLLPNPQSSGAETKPRVFLQTPFDERDAKFQPGSGARLLAYTSNESGRYEVYIQSISGGAADRGSRWQVSPDGGSEPVWATDGRELYYREGDKMMAVEIRTTPSIAAGKPRLLFEGFYERGILGTSAFDVAPDGWFVMARGAQHESPPTQLRLVTNWFAELRAKVQ
jgi:Tol biopolymer transport system component